MGGLFRFRGNRGQNFEGQDSFRFDDNKTIQGQELTEYFNSWNNKDGDLQVGVYVGVGKPHKQWEGETLKDLWPFLKKSNEARSCLTRRFAEYFLGKEQVYDGIWMDQLAKNIKPGPESGKGVKKLVKDIVLSKTFAHPNPEKGTCYDFVGDAPAENQPPCEIAAIVKKHCASCHTDKDDLGIDFTKWIELPNGKFGFPHYNEDWDDQRDQTSSFEEIIARLTSTDSSVRMPQGGAMSESERQVMYHWLNNQIKDAEGE
jgi:hypothetical protein